jgi:RND family efflux transporter MFP subunit
VADARSNTFRTEVRLANPEHLLRPGVIARASLTRRVLRDALSVPLRALVPVKGQYVAFCVKDGRAVRRLVTIAAIVDSAVVVREGLQEGDAVVVEGQRALTDGAAVTVTAATSPAPASPDAPPPQAP